MKTEEKKQKEPDVYKDDLYKFPEIPQDPQPPQNPSQTIKDLEGSYYFVVTHRIPDTAAQTAANYGPVFVAPFPCLLVGTPEERHAVAGSDVGSVTLDIEKLASGTAKGSGTSMIASTFNLKGTADTPQTVNLSTTIGNRSLAAGEAVALKTSGTLTALKDVSVTLVFKVLIKYLPVL